jgi:hypothetical protein
MPIAALQTVVGPAAPSGRTPDTVLLPALLDQLAQARSLSDFYAREFALPNGELRQIDGCCDRVRKELDKCAVPLPWLIRRVYWLRFQIISAAWP